MTTFALSDNLNWTVSKRDLFYTGNDGQLAKWEDRVAIIRDDNDTCLGSVSPQYESLQNSALLSLVNPLVEEGLLNIENMGYLNRGARVFAQAKINQEFQVLGEEYNAYITILNGHTGTSSVAIGPTTTRVICGNTFAMAYADLSERFRHSTGVNERVLNSKSVINYVNGTMEVYAKNVEVLDNTPCSPGQFQKAVEKIYQKDAEKLKNYEMLNNLFYNGAGNLGRSYYDAFNALTDFNSNRARKTEASKFNYVQFGQGSRVNQRAMNVLSELVAV
jgi:phage/plasmid-like protein (TIGR03299 family)